MESQIVKWGNSQGIRLPRKMMEEAGMRLEDRVEITADRGRIVVQKSFRHRTLEERAAENGGKLGPYQEFDWGEPQDREML